MNPSPAPLAESAPTADWALWQAFRRGDETAFAQIYQTHLRLLYGYGNRLTSDRSLVEDAIHDVFIELWERRAFLGPTDSIRLYLFKALKRKLIRFLAQARQTDAPFGSEAAALLGSVESAEVEQIQSEFSQHQIEQLHRALDRLTPHQREAIFLRFQAGLGYDDIAALLAINYQSVVNLIFRAMRTLRRELAAVLAGLALTGCP